jgi:hypothetical protein
VSIIFKKTSEFERIRAKIEDHLYYSVLAIQKEPSAALKSVEHFTIAFDRFLSTIQAMYQRMTSWEKSLFLFIRDALEYFTTFES